MTQKGIDLGNSHEFDWVLTDTIKLTGQGAFWADLSLGSQERWYKPLIITDIKYYQSHYSPVSIHTRHSHTLETKLQSPDCCSLEKLANTIFLSNPPQAVPLWATRGGWEEMYGSRPTFLCARNPSMMSRMPGRTHSLYLPGQCQPLSPQPLKVLCLRFLDLSWNCTAPEKDFNGKGIFEQNTFYGKWKRFMRKLWFSIPHY